MSSGIPTIYPVCIHNHPVRYESKYPLRPILAGSALLDERDCASYTDHGYVLDRESDISELNPIFGELTAIKWIVENATEEYIGNAQYRRKWVQEDELNDSILYVPQPESFSYRYRGRPVYNLEQQFKVHHFDGVKMTMDLCASGKIPITEAEMMEVWKQNMLWSCLMVMGHRDIYIAFMTKILELSWELWEMFKDQISSIHGYDRRSVAFIAERWMTALIIHKRKFFDFEILNTPITMVHA